MITLQHDFVQFALQHQVLKFGSFTLKSGRVSPYFFNAGLFNTGEQLAQLGQFYAQALLVSDLKYDMLFGPAYKSIPLVTSTVINLADLHKINVPYAFNRKEIKDHGEGGTIVGSPLKGNVVIIDDVIITGTAIRESANIIQQHGATLSGILVAVDRQECGQEQQSVNVPVRSIVNLDHIIEYLEKKPEHQKILESMQAYKDEYGCTVS